MEESARKNSRPTFRSATSSGSGAAGNRQWCTERDHGKDQDGGDGGHGRSQVEQPVVGGSRENIFFGEEFDQVCQGLQQAEGADTVGPFAVLNPGQDPSLGEYQISGQGQDDEKYQPHLGREQRYVHRRCCHVDLRDTR